MSPARRRSKKPREATEFIVGDDQANRNEQLREILRQSAALFAQLAELAKTAEVLFGEDAVKVVPVARGPGRRE